MTKTISLLGSTGSIGRQTLQVARELGLSVAALTANRQVDLLEQQARTFHPILAAAADPTAAAALAMRLSDTDIRVLAGEAISTIRARSILQLAVTTLAVPAAATSVSVFHFSRKS